MAEAAPPVALDPWELADPLRAVRFHATRQRYAGEQIARCMVSRFVRYYPHGVDQLPVYQAIQADAYRRMSAAYGVLSGRP